MRTAPDTVRPRPVLLAIGITVAAGGLVVAWAALLRHARPAPVVAAAPPASSIVGPSPALEARARAERALTEWSWVDRERGVVTMPIDEAMALVAAGAP